FALPTHLLAAAFPQWMAMPTKSVCASAGFETASFHSGEPVPKTFVMSPDAFVAVFSSSMFAVPTPPTSHPARVNGTHGAGVFLPVSVTMFGLESAVPFVSSTRSVQYLNDDDEALVLPVK